MGFSSLQHAILRRQYGQNIDKKPTKSCCFLNNPFLKTNIWNRQQRYVFHKESMVEKEPLQSLLPLFNSRLTTTAAARTTTSLQMAKKSGTKKKKIQDGTITVNKLAYRNYEVVEKLEAGVSLTGTEIKSIRQKGSMNIRDGYVKTDKLGRCTLHNVHIAKYAQCGEYFQHEEMRIRTLLIHKSEARKLSQKTDMTGMTIVPLKAYFSGNNKVKFEIALVKGKNTRDKRATIRQREGDKETRRIIKNFRIN